MSSNQETMRTTIKVAADTKTSAVVTALNNHQSTIAAGGIQAGYRNGFPTGFATFDAAVKSANAQKAIDLFTAESGRQGSVFTAKDLLRSQGEIPF